MTLKQIIIAILQALLALARTPTEETASIDAQKKKIQLLRDDLNTYAADSEFNSDEVGELIDDHIEVASTSEPSEDYAEVPKDPDSEVEGEKEEKPATEQEEGEAEAEQEEEKKETPRQRRLREEAEAEKAKAKKPSKKSL